MTDLREKLADLMDKTLGEMAKNDTHYSDVPEILADAIIAALPGMVPEFDEDDRTKIINTAYANLRRYGLGVRGQITTEWDGIESHVVGATRAAIMAALGVEGE